MAPSNEDDDSEGATGRQFEELALPCLPDVARFALSLTRDRADADDLVQETYLRAFRHWHTFVVGNAPRRWLFTICRNTFIRSRRSPSRVIESDEGDVDAMPAVVAHAMAYRDGLGNLFDEIDVRPAIERAVDELPEPHRSVLVLVDVEGQSYDEAAAVLGVPIGTVRSRLFRARRAIQGALIEHARDAGIGKRLRNVEVIDD
ncbi:MAG: sigma-70 family RNA polymerase sigma factor [Gemmatimonadaceae bacterium]